MEENKAERKTRKCQAAVRSRRALLFLGRVVREGLTEMMAYELGPDRGRTHAPKISYKTKMPAFTVAVQCCAESFSQNKQTRKKRHPTGKEEVT